MDAAIILIGNELLSGKIRDENATWLASRLRSRGVDLRRICTIADIEADIVSEVRGCAERFTHVITSGGVGPTHDDITLSAIAKAFDVPTVLHETLADLLRRHFGARLTPDHLRMAEVPEGAALVAAGPILWPVIRFQNVWILPGVPELFRAKFESIEHEFQGLDFYIRNLWLNADEGQIAALLRRVESETGVQIGSYPRFDSADHRVRVTVEARAAGPVDAAVATLLSELPTDGVVRVDPPLGSPTSVPPQPAQATDETI